MEEGEGKNEEEAGEVGATDTKKKRILRRKRVEEPISPLLAGVLVSATSVNGSSSGADIT